MCEAVFLSRKPPRAPASPLTTEMDQKGVTVLLAPGGGGIQKADIIAVPEGMGFNAHHGGIRAPFLYLVYGITFDGGVYKYPSHELIRISLYGLGYSLVVGFVVYTIFLGKRAESK